MWGQLTTLKQHYSNIYIYYSIRNNKLTDAHKKKTKNLTWSLTRKHHRRNHKQMAESLREEQGERVKYVVNKDHKYTCPVQTTRSNNLPQSSSLN